MTQCFACSHQRQVFRSILIAAALAAATLATVRAACGQEPTPPSAPTTTPTTPVSPTPTGTEPTGPTDSTRFVTPSFPAPTSVPESGIFVPAPTVPSTAAPSLPRAGGAAVPPGAVFGVGFGVTASEEYTDNFNLDTSGNKQSNFRTVLSPSVGLAINSAFTKGAIQYALSAAHDSSQKGDDINFFHSLVGSVSWEATPRLRLTVIEGFTYSDEPTQADRLSLRRQRQTFTSNTLGLNADYVLDRITTGAYYRLSTFDSDPDKTTSHTAGATVGYRLSETDSLSASYEYLLSTTDGQATVSSNTSLGANASDITGHRISGSYTRQINALLTAGLTGSYSIRRTESRNATPNENFDSWTLAVFNSYGTPKLSLNGSIGVTQIIPESSKTETGVFSASTLVYRFARAVATIGVDSGFSETFAQGENFGVVQTRGVTASLAYPFTPSISGTVAAFLRQNEPTGSDNSSSNAETSWGLSVAFGFQITRWLNMFLDYTHSQTSSDQAISRTNSGSGDQTENRVRLSLTAGF